jgi:large exoprotein involved in heme utilization and adhesion
MPLNATDPADPLARRRDQRATSRLGLPGRVAIEAPEQDVAGGLVTLPAGFLDAATLLPASCAARRSADFSSFTAAGRGGLPPGPDAPLPGFYGLESHLGTRARPDL